MSDALKPEAPEKWLCDCCGDVCDKPLSAPNPFDFDDYLQGCPSCKRAETLTQACQFPGCKRAASSGTPGAHGYRYFWACGLHHPKGDDA